MRWIRGNGEREIAEAVGAPPPADGTTSAALDQRRRVGDERALALGALPLTVELDGVLYCHAAHAATTRCSPASRPPSASRTRSRG